ncbi:MAG: glycosyltransferase family 4 protein [Candidatus Omnitrophota bacterium]
MNQAKKILFIITYLELGGAQKQLFYLIENLDRDKYSLYLCAGDSGYLKDKFTAIDYLKVHLIPELIRTINPLYDITAFFKLYSYIRKNKFDIVHTHSPKASILGRWAAYFAGVKSVVYTVHGWPFHNFMNPLAYHLYLTLEKLTAKITKKIVVVSKRDLREALDKKITRGKKLSLVHYGIDINYFSRIYLDRKKRSFDECLVVSVSALKRQKGLNYLLNIAGELKDKLPQIRFVIVGDGPLRGKIEKMIRKSGLTKKVVLKGWLDDLSSLYANASLFVLTSLWEGLPVSLIEAVAAGIPVLVTNTGGVSDIVKNNKQGRIVKLDDLSRLPLICEDMLDNIDSWTKTVEGEREHIVLDSWSEERMVKETEQIYKGMVS